MKKLLLSCSFAALSVTAVRAQIAIGPEAGINISTYVGKTGGVKQTYTHSIPAAHLGVVADVAISGKLHLLPGLYYTRNGFNVTATDYYGNSYPVEYRVSTLELPVNILYKFGQPGHNQFVVGLGPYAGLNMGGKITSDFMPVGHRSLNIGSNITDDIKPVDVGAGISAGYELAGGFLIHLHYQRSFINLQPQGNSDNTMHNVNYGASLAYLFNVKAKKARHAETQKIKAKHK